MGFVESIKIPTYAYVHSLGTSLEMNGSAFTENLENDFMC